MPKKIGLVPYALRLWNKEDDRYYVTNRLPENKTLQDHIHAYLAQRHTQKSVLNALQSAIRVDRHQTSGNSIEGIIKCGDYGYAADLENLRTGYQFRRGIHDCEYLPFFFKFLFKNGQNEAIVLLQRFGVNGIKTVLEDDCASYIEACVPDSRLSLNPIVSVDYIRECLGGGIRRIRYVKFSVPADVADDIGVDDHIENDASMELSIKAKRSRHLGIPGWMRAGQIGASNAIEISGVQYDDVKLEIDIDGNKKTVDLADLRKFNMSLDVTENVQFGIDGHPTYESMRQAADGILPMITSAIRWEDQ